MSAWSPADFVVDGVFATYDDLRHATAELARITGSRVIVATFSTRYLLPSASCVHSGDEDWNAASSDRLQERLQEQLRAEPDQTGYVARQAVEILSEVGTRQPSSAVFGGHLERSGRLAVVVASGALGSDAAQAQAAMCAACALGSRAVAFSRDNSIDQSVLRAGRLATATGAANDGAASRAEDPVAIKGLLAFARESLGASAVVVYEGDVIHPHRSEVLERRVGSWSTLPVPEWMSGEVHLPEDREVPVTPELGGSRFETLGELVEICAVKNRRLVGVVAGTNRAYGLPYGFEPVLRRPMGVLCMVWGSSDERRVGVYEMAVSRIVALHLARAYDERRWGTSVHLVTSQLSYISALPTSPSRDALTACAPELVGRLDVALVAESVTRILEGLAELSGAMSVTCRLLAGADGAPLSRHLLRLHCEGEGAPLGSPVSIALADSARSVNAWVGVNGRRVWLRDLVYDAEAGGWKSPDMSDYPGLEQVTMVRRDIRAELCVPIFAERRLVGTVNLESDRIEAFDTTAQIVAEYAQLIGITLLEARRRIGVDTVTEAGGFLDHRHLLEAELISFGEAIVTQRGLSDYKRRQYRARINELKRVVRMRRVPDIGDLHDHVSVWEVVHAAMKSVDWADTDTPVRELVLAGGEQSSRLLAMPLHFEPANALKFAIGQALHNVRRHGGDADGLLGRSHLAMFRLSEQVIGGEANIYVAVSSTCSGETVARLETQRIFREPIEHAGSERTSLGNYLAGEAVRRCGGSAYLRVYPRRGNVAIVEAEFSVPLATPIPSVVTGAAESASP